MPALHKYLEKSGMNLSYMKNAVRAARAAGTPILRNAAQVTEHIDKNVVSPWIKKIPFVGDSLHRIDVESLAKPITMKGPAAFPELNGPGSGFVHMPRDFTQAAGPGYSPRAALLHELGHSQHFSEDPVTARGLISRTYDSHINNAVNANLSETIANNNAILGMREGGVPEHLIDTYKDRVQSPFYNSYARKLTGALDSPTGNMKLPARMVHGAVERLKRFGQNITDSGGLAGTYHPPLPTPTPILPKLDMSPAARPKLNIKDLMARLKGMAATQPPPFAPVKEIPTYTHPIAQEFNVPYSVK